MRLPFFGLLAVRSPLEGLTEHYAKVKEGITVVRDSMECLVQGGTCEDRRVLAAKMDKIEDEADKIKRKIRNHLPRRLFMPVDKTLFLNYTKSQDNILDDAQVAMHWLAMRKLVISDEYKPDVIGMIEDVAEMADLLEPALTRTLGLINTEHLDRNGTKDQYRAVRAMRHQVFKNKNALISRIYNSDMDFKDIYQFIHFIESLEDMARNMEHCADTLRSMIAR
jgi:hypothetical protein